VKTEDGPAVQGALVAFVPDPPLREEPSRYSTAKTDQYGHFIAANLAPGNYKVFAWERIHDGEYQDPEFLRSVEDQGAAVEVSGGQKTTVELKLVPSPE
jgi:hypothetical protein